MAGHVVTGAAVVLRVAGGGERYLYRGAPVPDGAFVAESVEHAVSVGLLAEVPDEEPEPAEEQEPVQPSTQGGSKEPEPAKTGK